MRLVTNRGMRHLTITMSSSLFLLCTQSACDLDSRSVGSDGDALPGGQTYQTRAYFGVEYGGEPTGIALADDGSFVVKVQPYGSGGVRPTRFHHYDAEGNPLGVYEDPTMSAEDSSAWFAYDMKSAGNDWLFLARHSTFENDDERDWAHVRLIELHSDGTFESLATVPCHHDECRMSYEPSADTAWTVTHGDGQSQAQRWSLLGEPLGPAVSLTQPAGAHYTKPDGGLLVAALDDDAGVATVSSFDAGGELVWTNAIDTSPYDNCYQSMMEQSLLLECDRFVEDGGWHQYRASVDADGMASVFAEWTGDPGTVAAPDQRSVAFGPHTMTIYDAAGTPLETGPGPLAAYLGGYSDVEGNRIAILSVGGEFDPVSVAVIELE